MDTEFPDFMTATEVCALFRVSMPTVRHWVAHKKIPSYKIGRKRLFDRRDLLRYIEERRTGASGE